MSTDRESDDRHGAFLALSWVRKQEVSRPTLKLLLMCLASYVDRNFECWPSVKTLAQDTGQTERAIWKQLAELAELGLLVKTSRTRSNGSSRSNVYRLPVTKGARARHPEPPCSPTLFDGSVDEGVTLNEETGRTLNEGSPLEEPLRRTTLSPSSQHHDEAPSASADADGARSAHAVEDELARRRRASDISPATESDWDEFWEAYPRKVGKKAARKAFGAAVKKTTKQGLMSALAAQKAAMWSGRDAQFIPHPATWLNNERWDDAVEAEVVGGESIEDRSRRWEAARLAREERKGNL